MPVGPVDGRRYNRLVHRSDVGIVGCRGCPCAQRKSNHPHSAACMCRTSSSCESRSLIAAGRVRSPLVSVGANHVVRLSNDAAPTPLGGWRKIGTEPPEGHFAHPEGRSAAVCRPDTRGERSALPAAREGRSARPSCPAGILPRPPLGVSGFPISAFFDSTLGVSGFPISAFFDSTLGVSVIATRALG